MSASPPTDAERLQAENDYLAAQIAKLEAAALTPEELTYLRKRKEQDERAAWAWQVIRTHAPWLLAIGSALGSAAYWFLTHTISIGPKS